jgi:hypothetical protein
MLLSAVGALVLAAGGAPAVAGGYWDGGDRPLPSPPGEAYHGCDRGCPTPPPPPCGCRSHRYAEDDEDFGPPPQPAQGVIDFDGGVGPAFVDSGSGGGGAVFVDNRGFAGVDLAFFARQHFRAQARARAFASAHASAFASAHVQTSTHVQVHVRQPQMRQMKVYRPAPSYHMSGGHGRW